MIQTIKNTLRKYLYDFEVSKAFKEFEENAKTSEQTYRKFRQVFVLSRGRFNDRLSEKIVQKVGKDINLNPQGILGKMSPEQMRLMINKMKSDGFYVFENSLPETKIKSIYDFALQEPVNYLRIDTNAYSKEKVLFDSSKIISPRYNFPRSSILNSPDLQDLIFDDSLRAFAQEYLGCKPILDHLAFWWSAPFKGKGKSRAAQMYHFDMDRIKFIKFFFYLSDVTTETGPHCYVKGSHKKLPPEIKRDGRYTDEETEKIFGKGKCTEITGKKGSIIAVDTRGFHKGKDLMKNERLLFQIEYSISMFGQYYAPLDKAVIKDKFKERAASYTYKFIFR